MLSFFKQLEIDRQQQEIGLRIFHEFFVLSPDEIIAMWVKGEHRCMVYKAGDRTIALNTSPPTREIITQGAEGKKEEKALVNQKYEAAVNELSLKQLTTFVASLEATDNYEAAIDVHKNLMVMAKVALEDGCYDGDLIFVTNAHVNGATIWELVCSAGALLVALNKRHVDIFEFILNNSDCYKQGDADFAPAYEVLFKLAPDTEAVRQMQDMMMNRILQDIAVARPDEDITWALQALRLKPELINKPIPELNGLTPAMLLVITGRLQSLVWLQENNHLDFKQTDDSGRTILDLAIISGHKEIIDWLVVQMAIELSALLVACKQQDVAKLDELLASAAADVVAQHTVALYFAVIYGFHEGVIRLAAKLAATDSPLFLIATKQHDLRMMQILIDAGLDVTAHKGAALSYAIANKVELLIEYLARQDKMYSFAQQHAAQFTEELQQAGFTKTIAQFRFGIYADGVAANLATIRSRILEASLSGARYLESDELEASPEVSIGRLRQLEEDGELSSPIEPFEKALQAIAQQCSDCDTQVIAKGFPRVATLSSQDCVDGQCLENLVLPIAHLHSHYQNQLPTFIKDALEQGLGSIAISYQPVGNVASRSYKFYINYQFNNGQDSTLLGVLSAEATFDPAKREVIGIILDDYKTKATIDVAVINANLALAAQLAAYIELQSLRNFSYQASGLFESFEQMPRTAINYPELPSRKLAVDNAPVIAVRAESTPAQYSARLKARVQQTLDEYDSSRRAAIAEVYDAIDKVFAEIEQALEAQGADFKVQRDAIIEQIDKLYDSHIREQIDAHNCYIGQQLEEAKRANRRAFQRLGWSLVLSPIAGLGAGALASGLSTGGAAIVGGGAGGLTSSLINGTDPFEGTIRGMVFAGIGQGVDKVLSNANIVGLQHTVLSSTATAALSTVTTEGSKFGLNLAVSVTSNVAGEMVLPGQQTTFVGSFSKVAVTALVASSIGGKEIAADVMFSALGAGLSTTIVNVATNTAPSITDDSAYARQQASRSILPPARPKPPGFDPDFLAAPGYQYISGNTYHDPVEIRMIPRDDVYYWANNPEMVNAPRNESREEFYNPSSWATPVESFTNTGEHQDYSPSYNEQSEGVVRSYIPPSRGVFSHMAGSAAARVVSTVEFFNPLPLFASSDSYMSTGEYQDYSLPASGQVTSGAREFAHVPPSGGGLMPIFEAYVGNYNSRMRAADDYSMAGNSFMAGYTRTKAQADVEMDAFAVATLGYGAVRGAAYLGSNASTLGSKIRNLTGALDSRALIFSSERSLLTRPNNFSTRPASSLADYSRLQAELHLKQAGLLDANGELTRKAIGNSMIIKDGPELHNPRVIGALTRDGSIMKDWGKYTTKDPVIMPNGQKLQIHFYYNEVTGKVDYGYIRDFKVKQPVSLLDTYSIKGYGSKQEIFKLKGR